MTHDYDTPNCICLLDHFYALLVYQREFSKAHPGNKRLVAGLIVAVVARRMLAGNWSGAVALKKDHELITTGFYQYVRHPIYAGMLLMIF